MGVKYVVMQELILWEWSERCKNMSYKDENCHLVGVRKRGVEKFDMLSSVKTDEEDR